MKVELGLTSFAENSAIYMPDGKHESISHAQRIRDIVEEIELADQLGLDVYGLGEHHREDYAVSDPVTVLGAAASRTQHIKLSSAVTVLSSDDPVRVYERFSTLDAVSNGRAEIMIGRGSFIESFPLFGYNLNDYEELFNEKLQMLLKINKHEIISWEGKLRPSLEETGIYPRVENGELPIWIATGGTPESSLRAGAFGLPITYAIIGGNLDDLHVILKYINLLHYLTDIILSNYLLGCILGVMLQKQMNKRNVSFSLHLRHIKMY